MRRRQFLGFVGASAALFLPTSSFAKPRTPETVVKPGSVSLKISGRDFTYEWQHKGKLVHVEFEMPRSFSLDMVRATFEDLPHRESKKLYVQMARADPFRPSFVRRLAIAIGRKAAELGVDPVELCLSLVQGMTYVVNKPRQNWPTETFLDREADCSDSSVAFASLVDIYQRQRHRGPRYWCFLYTESHMAVGVRNFHWGYDGRVNIRKSLKSKSRRLDTRYAGIHYLIPHRIRDVPYYMCETTDRWDIGEIGIGRVKFILPHKYHSY